MRIVFLLFGLFSIGIFNAQTGKEEEKSNGAIPSVSNAPAMNSTNSTITRGALDTVSYKLEEIQLKSSDKIDLNKSKQKKSNESSSSQSQVNQKKMEFSKAKTASSTQRNQRTPTTEQQQIMNKQVEDMEQIAPNSFDYNLMYYSSGNYDVSRETELIKAEEQQPENTDVIRFRAANAIVKGDTLQAKTYLKKLEEKQIIQPETVSYTQDVIISSGTSSTIVTHGFNDSYGTYFNQFNQNLAPNTTVISLDFMQSDSYRNVLKKKGYELPKQKTVDVPFLKSFCELNQQKNIALSMTIPKEYFEPIKDNIFVSGLIFEYKPKLSQQSYQKLESIWNQKLNKKVINQFISPLSNSYSLNYLPMLIYLEEYYQNSGDKTKTMEIKSDIDRVRKKAGISNQMKKKKE
ncbi:MAG: hypothetical protein ACKO7P_03340 [Bacteroidota bacterium]